MIKIMMQNVDVFFMQMVCRSLWRSESHWICEIYLTILLAGVWSRIHFAYFIALLQLRKIPSDLSILLNIIEYILGYIHDVMLTLKA